ncbi:MAG: VanW family protein [Coriobacteriia bacterium]|nr:VanW family protein [Coriobacteriia bacterium]
MPNDKKSDMLEYWKTARREIDSPPTRKTHYRSQNVSSKPKPKPKPVVPTMQPKPKKISFIDYLKSNKKFAIIIIVILTILLLGLIDFIVFYGRAHPGVKVGDIDLGFKSIEEAQCLITDTYEPRLNNNTVVVYVDEEAREKGVDDNGGSGLNEQLSVEQAKKTAQYWKVRATDLNAKLPSQKLADEAVNSTRGIFNIFNRIGAAIFGKKIDVYADFDEDALSEQVAKVNDTMATSVVNPTVKIVNADAQAIEGSDGNEVLADEFTSQLNKAFFVENQADSNFIANLHPATQKVTFSCAQELATKINNSLSRPVKFNYNSNIWDVSASDLGSWISVNIENRSDEKTGGCSCSNSDGNWCICAKIDPQQASKEVLSHARGQLNNDKTINVSFTNENNKIVVKPSDTFDIPNVSETVQVLNDEWLQNPVVYKNNASGKNSGSTSVDKSELIVNVNTTTVPEKLSFDEAIDLGIIGEITSFQTTYSSGAGTENRNYNIALVSSMLDNTICRAGGNIWSYNEITGECNADKGFKEAGSVYGTTYTKEAGGGICQVATTVFNAAYEAGYEIVERTNHDLHIASYPAGRDAAVSYPSPNLIWRNDTDSDVLVKLETTGYSVTCTLYGVSPNYRVETETGDWSPGDKYKTETVVDNTKPANTSYIQTSGSDGKSIVVKRKVFDKNGKLIREDVFKSNYKPKTEIKVIGPGPEADKLLASGEARLKNEHDNW